MKAYIPTFDQYLKEAEENQIEPVRLSDNPEKKGYAFSEYMQIQAPSGGYLRGKWLAAYKATHRKSKLPEYWVGDYVIKPVGDDPSWFVDNGLDISPSEIGMTKNEFTEFNKTLYEVINWSNAKRETTYLRFNPSRVWMEFTKNKLSVPEFYQDKSWKIATQPEYIKNLLEYVIKNKRGY